MILDKRRTQWYTDGQHFFPVPRRLLTVTAAFPEVSRAKVKRPVLKKHEAEIRAQPDRGAHTFTVMQ